MQARQVQAARAPRRVITPLDVAATQARTALGAPSVPTGPPIPQGGPQVPGLVGTAAYNFANSPTVLRAVNENQWNQILGSRVQAFQRGFANIGQPVTEFTNPPGSVKTPYGVFSGEVMGQAPAEDGTGTDWVINSRAGAPITAPRTRQVKPGVLRQVAQALGASLNAGLQGLNIGAEAIETGLANIGRGLNVGVPVTEVFTRPDGMTFDPGTVPIQAAPGAQFTQRITNRATVRDVATQLWGDTPAVTAALDTSSRIGYTGIKDPNAQLRLVARQVDLGQAPEEAVHGDPDYVERVLVPLGYADNALRTIQSDPLAKYIYEEFKRRGRTDDQIVEMFNVRGLPGEEDILVEAIGQSILDPLSLITPGARVAVEEQRIARTLRWFGASDRPLAETLNLIRKTRQLLVSAIESNTPQATPAH